MNWESWLKSVIASRAKSRAEACIRARAAADSSLGPEREKRLRYAQAIHEEMYLRHDLPHTDPDVAISVAEQLAVLRIEMRDGWKPWGVK